MSGPMVRAILEGRKTQTRRIVRFPAGVTPADVFVDPGGTDLFGPGPYVKFAPYDLVTVDDNGIEHSEEISGERIRCPYGAPGDRLWVRETWCQAWDDDRGRWFDPPRAHYAADGKHVVHVDGVLTKSGRERSPWRPSIFMPRWASRLLLEVTAVRVERLQDISPADAETEGVGFGQTGCDGECGATPCALAVATFGRLWDRINAKRAPWASNPWVWVIEFRRAEAAGKAA